MLDRIPTTDDVRADQDSSTDLAAQFTQVRKQSASLIRELSAEDTALQSMADTSPAKWHLAHTTWFFEQFLLGRDAGYKVHRPRWDFLFNSYYQSVGPMHSRPHRGLLSRPGLAEVLEYREVIDACVQDLMNAGLDQAAKDLIELGLHHEQQHQELLLTDIKHLLSCNPLQPAYRDPATRPASETATHALPLQFLQGAKGLVEIGHQQDGFAFDCETPRHTALLHPHALANRCVSNAEYLAFIRDGGYRQATLWLSEGWNTVQREGWAHPLYWSDDLQTEFTLYGPQPIDPNAPVSHVSYFEADAYARWAGARLPTETEWESAAAPLDVTGNFVGSGALHPKPPGGGEGLHQMFGDVWEWTASPYVSYPGFKPAAGSLGEYNGKFMCGQQVLRGGSCVTPDRHVRASYRNFFYPADRWQFMGIRIAKDLES